MRYIVVNPKWKPFDSRARRMHSHFDGKQFLMILFRGYNSEQIPQMTKDCNKMGKYRSGSLSARRRND